MTGGIEPSSNSDRGCRTQDINEQSSDARIGGGCRSRVDETKNQDTNPDHYPRSPGVPDDVAPCRGDRKEES